MSIKNSQFAVQPLAKCNYVKSDQCLFKQRVYIHLVPLTFYFELTPVCRFFLCIKKVLLRKLLEACDVRSL